MMLSGPDPMCNGPCSLRLFGQLSLVPGPHSEPHEVFDELGYLYVVRCISACRGYRSIERVML